MSSQEVAIIPFTVDQISTMAKAVASSGLFGLKTYEQAMALMLVAQSEGLHPGRAAMEYHVIQGRPSLKADAMLARFQKAGGKVEWHDYTDDKVSGTFSHPQGGKITVDWTTERAIKAEIIKVENGKKLQWTQKDGWKPGNYEKYPRAMFRSRCISEGVRSVFPGVSVGMYTSEECEDFGDANAIMIDQTPVAVKVEAPIQPVIDDIRKLTEDAKELASDIELSDTEDKLTSAVTRFAKTIDELSKRLPAWHKRIIELIEKTRASYVPVDQPQPDEASNPLSAG